MSRYVIDANVVAKWFVPEPLSDEAVRLINDQDELAVPDLLWPEIGSVLWKKCRLGQLTAREAARILAALGELPLAVFPSRGVVEAAVEIALATGRSVYDSVYLALAVALECQLVTADERMVNALSATPFATTMKWIGTREGSN